jgi:hypothetical protein
VFYVNGLNITNFVNGIGATVPFEFYKSVEVKTGGYPAEFGRGTGAVINAVTKSGSNDFTFAIHGNYEPDSLREEAPNTTDHPQLAEEAHRQELHRRSRRSDHPGPPVLLRPGQLLEPERRRPPTCLGHHPRGFRPTYVQGPHGRPVLRLQAGRLHHRPSAPRIHLLRHQPQA